MDCEHLYHVTILSNLARGYDKYGRIYSKTNIQESRFADRFYLLPREELATGVARARSLLARTGLDGDRLLILQTHADPGEVIANRDTGVGVFVQRNWIALDALHSLGDDLTLEPLRTEEAYAASLQVLSPTLKSYQELTPRSVSVLPVALACQASCPFCFSKASVSAEQETRPIDWIRVREVLNAARERGAERAVITGGGEPGLMPLGRLLQLVRECAAVLPRVVLITNGYFLQQMPEARRAAVLGQLSEAGLSVLSVSRHHHDDAHNARVMGLETQPQRIAALRQGNPLRLRWVCVLQKGGIDSANEMASYLDWAVGLGVTEFCFKELYVSTSPESVYHSREANEWSHQHQVPLRLVLDFARAHGWTEVERLPWGAPVYRGDWAGRSILVAAYTEPSLFWERIHGLARSWNLMADGRCLVSLEDRGSEVLCHELSAVSGVS